jgi:hypothetical protein
MLLSQRMLKLKMKLYEKKIITNFGVPPLTTFLFGTDVEAALVPAV